MNCKKCGSPLTENDQFCKMCGTPVNTTNNNEVKKEEVIQGSVPTSATIEQSVNTTSQPTYSQGATQVRSTVNQTTNTTSQPTYSQGTTQVRPAVNQTTNTTSQPTYSQGATQVRPAVNQATNAASQPTYSQGATQVRPAVNQTTNTASQPTYSQGATQVRPAVNQTTNAASQPSLSGDYNSNMKKKNTSSNNLIFIIIGVVVVLVVFVIIGLTSSKMYSNNKKSNDNNSVSQKNYYKVNFKNFQFSIPDDLVYEVQNDYLLIGDAEGTWVADLELGQGSFSQIKAKKNQLATLLKQSGFKSSSDVIEKTINGLDYVLMEGSMSGQNLIVGYTKINSMYFAAVSAYNLDNEFDYSILEKVSTIINSASYSESTSNMSTPNIDLMSVKELTK